jgi:hypothetical protein
VLLFMIPKTQKPYFSKLLTQALSLATRVVCLESGVIQELTVISFIYFMFPEFIRYLNF